MSEVKKIEQHKILNQQENDEEIDEENNKENDNEENDEENDEENKLGGGIFKDRSELFSSMGKKKAITSVTSSQTQGRIIKKRNKESEIELSERSKIDEINSLKNINNNYIALCTLQPDYLRGNPYRQDINNKLEIIKMLSSQGSKNNKNNIYDNKKSGKKHKKINKKRGGQENTEEKNMVTVYYF